MKKDKKPPYAYAAVSLNVADRKEVSTNNRCKFIASFIVFPGFRLNVLQRLFSDNS